VGCGVNGLGFMVYDLGFRVSGFCSRVLGVGFRAETVEERRVEEEMGQALDPELPRPAFQVSYFVFRFSGFGCRISGFGFRVSGFEFRV